MWRVEYIELALNGFEEIVDFWSTRLLLSEIAKGEVNIVTVEKIEE